MVSSHIKCKLCICIEGRNAIVDRRKLSINQHLEPVTRNNMSNGQSKRTQKLLRQTHLEKCSSLIQRCKLERLDCYYGALRSRCGHYILPLWFLLSILAIGQAIIFCPVVCIYLCFFLAYSQRSEIGCLPYFDTWCHLSGNLKCKSEMYWKYRTQKLRKKSSYEHHRTPLLGYIFATKG